MNFLINVNKGICLAKSKSMIVGLCRYVRLKIDFLHGQHYLRSLNTVTRWSLLGRIQFRFLATASNVERMSVDPCTDEASV